MESFFNNVTFNRTSNYSGLDSHCYYLYEYSRTFYIPLLHALVMVTGLVVNLFMLITLYSPCSNDSDRKSTALSDVEYFFSHVGVCDIATLLTIPVWATQTILVKGWVFGYMVCKVLKGVMTFCFQYGIFIMVYINIHRYMKVVHNKIPLKCMGYSTKRTRIFVSTICASLPALSALVDVRFYTVRSMPGNFMMCSNGMYIHLQLFTFWTKMNICFILPTLILLYCNVRIMYKISNHIRSNSFGNKLKRAQILPFLTVSLFMCCWAPWIASTIYYRSHVDCEEVKYVVLNVCIAIGNMHCITSPTLYIITRHRWGTRNSSFRSENSYVHTPLPQEMHKASQSVTTKQSMHSSSNEQDYSVN